MEERPSGVGLNHVGVGVPDLDAALAWYQEVLGWSVLHPPAVMDASDPQLGPALHAMLGPEIRRFRLAHLRSANGVGLQLFEFLDPAPPEHPTAGRSWGLGLFHLCVTDADIEGLAQRIVDHGGRQTGVFRAISGTDYAAAYCQDPWGNVIEINSHPYEETREFLADGTPRVR
jgi:catechol 2,3-dioxygenase-like lactoylglutathione lyase family enzyme